MTAAPTERTASHDEPPTAAGLDVAETDDYLCSLLLPRFVSMWKHLEIDGGGTHRLVWMQALLQGATLLATSGQTPAMTALGLKAVDSHPTTNRPQQATIAKWITFSVILPTVYRQLRLWYELSSTVLPSDAMARLAHERQRQLVGALLDTVGRTFPLMRLYALLSWWMGINHHSPQLSMTLAGISFIATRPPQHLFVTFAHRRWLYEELVRTMHMLAPFSSWADVSSLFTWILRPLMESWEWVRQRRVMRNDCRCPLCRSEPITIPYVTNCGHVYCFSCLWNATSNNARFPCRVCRHVVTSSRRYRDAEHD